MAQISDVAFLKKYLYKDRSDAQILALLNCVNDYNSRWTRDLVRFDIERNERLEQVRQDRIKERIGREPNKREKAATKQEVGLQLEFA